MRDLVFAGKEIPGYKKVQSGTISRQMFTARQIEGEEYDENEYIPMGNYKYPLRDYWVKECPESFVMPSKLSNVFLNALDRDYKWPISIYSINYDIFPEKFENLEGCEVEIIDYEGPKLKIHLDKSDLPLTY